MLQMYLHIFKATLIFMGHLHAVEQAVNPILAFYHLIKLLWLMF